MKHPAYDEEEAKQELLEAIDHYRAAYLYCKSAGDDEAAEVPLRMALAAYGRLLRDEMV